MKKDNAHLLHKAVSKCIDNKEISNNCRIIKASECGGSQNIPLFGADYKSNETEYCDVDLLIIKNNKVRVIIEIEESDIKPTQICGKFLTSAISSHYIHNYKPEGKKNNEIIAIGNPVFFVQVLDSSNLKINKTSKIEQGENLEKSIRTFLSLVTDRVQYKLIYCNAHDSENFNCEKIVKPIKSFLKET
jgi:hypothetical protein